MSFLTFNHPVPRPQSDEAYVDNVFFQWWYFDALLNNGSRLLTFIGHGDIRHPNEISINVVLRSPEGVSVSEEIYFPKSALRAAPDNFDMRFSPQSMVRYEKRRGGKGFGRYFLKIKFKRIDYELEIEPELPPFSPYGASGKASRPAILGAQLFSGRSIFKKDQFRYVTFVPRGRLLGKITVDGKTIEAAGRAYHEHGLFSFPINNMYTGWLWMHVDHPEWTLFSGTTFLPGSKFHDGRPFLANAYVQHNGECLMALLDYSTRMARWSNIYRRDAEAQGEKSVVWNADVKMARPGLNVNVRLKSTDILLYAVLDEHPIPGVEQYWAQTVAKAEVEVTGGRGAGKKPFRFEADAVLETMRNND